MQKQKENPNVKAEKIIFMALFMFAIILFIVAVSNNNQYLSGLTLMCALFFAYQWDKKNKQIREAEKELQTNITNNNNQISATDEIIKYKQLLDSGAINQQEFETKKKELLNL